MLAQRHLKFVALSSGEIDIDPAVQSQQLEMHVSNAGFVKAVDGLYLQVMDELKPHPRKVTPDECTRHGKLLTELGKRVSDLGVKRGYHNHMNTISEHPENLQRVMDASDPRYVGLELDTAHYVAGGGDPAEAILHYRDRLLVLASKGRHRSSYGHARREVPVQICGTRSRPCEFARSYGCVAEDEVQRLGNCGA